MSRNPKSTKRGEAWPSSSSEWVTEMQRKLKDADKNTEMQRGLTNGMGSGK